MAGVAVEVARVGALSDATIVSLAEAYGVPARERKGRIELRDDGTIEGRGVSRWVDATGWTLAELLRWLGE